jgi:flagellar assembly protein FliH
VIRRIPMTEVQGRAEPLYRAARGTVEALDDRRVDANAQQQAALARALTLLLSEELQLSPTHIRRVLERELLRVRTATQLIVRVHPDDLALLASSADYVATLELAGSLEFVSDATLARGGCVLTSNLGEIDARIETRLGLALALLRSGAFA